MFPPSRREGTENSYNIEPNKVGILRISPPEDGNKTLSPNVVFI
jgi:hypothetical protein